MISIISASQAEGGKVVDYAKSYLKTIDEVIARGPYADTWESLGAYQIPEWFKRDKFGIFIHWGVYSVPAFGNEWYSRNMYVQGSREFEHHRTTWGEHAQFGYKDFIPLFKAENFDPEEWAELFEQAGAKYVVPVAEHHDGFQMYRSELLIERLETHVKTVVGKYKGQIYSWDVVNEVLNDRGEIRGINDDSKWKAIIGDADGDGYDSDYIELVFKFAREADPDAQLIINDYGLESRGMKRTGMYNLVKRMLEKGIPVDGVGLQMHINVFTPSVYEIEEAIELFASLKEYNPDFTVLVTEMDMSVYRWMEGKKEITDELLELQAQRYAEIFAMFKRQAEKGNLSTVVMWGLGDADSWLENFPIRGRGDAGLLFDKQF